MEKITLVNLTGPKGEPIFILGGDVSKRRLFYGDHNGEGKVTLKSHNVALDSGGARGIGETDSLEDAYDQLYGIATRSGKELATSQKALFEDMTDRNMQV